MKSMKTIELIKKVLTQNMILKSIVHKLVFSLPNKIQREVISLLQQLLFLFGWRKMSMFALIMIQGNTMSKQLMKSSHTIFVKRITKRLGQIKTQFSCRIDALGQRYTRSRYVELGVVNLVVVCDESDSLFCVKIAIDVECHITFLQGVNGVLPGEVHALQESLENLVYHGVGKARGQGFAGLRGINNNSLLRHTIIISMNKEGQLQIDHHSNMIRMKTIKDDNVRLVDYAIEKQQTQQYYKPLIVTSLIQLTYSFMFGIFVYLNLDVDQIYGNLTGAYNVIRAMQRQQDQLIITSVRIGPKCNSTIGSFPGTDRGCICPDMTTTTQLCLPPCKILDSMPTRYFQQFDGLRFCVTYGEEEGYNSIKEHPDGELVIQDRSYRLQNSRADFFGPFYKFIIAPQKPCYNTKLGQMKESQLSYPFSDIKYIGCDEYGAWKYDAVELAVTTFGRLIEENQINIESYPYFYKYHSKEDTMRLFLLRKHFIEDGETCHRAARYKFTTSYISCLMIQVVELIVCYFAFSFFALGAIFALMVRLVKNSEKKKIRFKIKMTDVLEKSIMILGVSMAIVMLLSQLILLYGILNDNGLERTARYTEKVFNLQCFTSPGIMKAIQQVRDTVQTCSQGISVYVLAWMFSELGYLVVGYLLLRSKFHQ